MRRYRVHAEYGTGSVWDDEWDGVREINPTPSMLGASSELQAAFEAWESEYERTFDAAYPPDGGCSSEDDLAAFNRAGELLATRLQAELGRTAVVGYRPL